MESQDQHIMRCRCVHKRGCQRDNFLYEFNQMFTTTITINRESRHFKKRLSQLDEGKRKKLTDIELCQLSVPPCIEVLGPGKPEELPPSIQAQQNWPKPGQDALNPRPLFQEIQHAGQMLDHKKDHHWREDDGGPSEVVISSILNKSVNREQVDLALPNLRRRVA